MMIIIIIAKPTFSSLIGFSLHILSSKTVLMGYRKCIFKTSENPGSLASRTEFYGTPGQSSLIPIKPVLLRENRDDWDYYCSAVGHVWNSTSRTLRAFIAWHKTQRNLYQIGIVASYSI